MFGNEKAEVVLLADPGVAPPFGLATLPNPPKVGLLGGGLAVVAVPNEKL